MNYLTSLLAFSSIMIVLATLTTVVVEFIHTMLRKRSGDFETQLAQLYRGAIRPTMESAGRAVEERTDHFVEQLVRNPAFLAPEKRWFARLPVIGHFLSRFGDTSFRSLSTRQFVEQLRQTEVGTKLAEASDAEATKLLGKLAWEFERYGEAASTYFRQRATMFSLLVAFVIAITFNIDSFRLFTALAQDQSLSERVIAGIDVNELEARFQDRLDAAGEGERAAVQKSYGEMLAAIRSESRSLEDLALPIGTAFYPYCSPKNVAGSAGADSTSFADPRCPEAPVASTRTISIPLIGGLLSEGLRLVEDVYRRVISARDGWRWLLNIIVSTGLIGLGAPFWFKTFRTVASLIPGANTDSDTTMRPQQERARPPSQPTPLAPPASGTAPATAGAGNQPQPRAARPTAGVNTAGDAIAVPAAEVQQVGASQRLLVAFQNASPTVESPAPKR